MYAATRAECKGPAGAESGLSAFQLLFPSGSVISPSLSVSPDGLHLLCLVFKSSLCFSVYRHF